MARWSRASTTNEADVKASIMNRAQSKRRASQPTDSVTVEAEVPAQEGQVFSQLPSTTNSSTGFADESKPQKQKDLVLDFGTDSDNIGKLRFKGKALTRFKADKWQCLLCRTQFPSEDKLAMHLEQSDLHLDNLKDSKNRGQITFTDDRLMEQPALKKLKT